MMRRTLSRAALAAGLLVPGSLAWAGDPVLNSGDTAWMIVATALVMVMTPAGLALFGLALLGLGLAWRTRAGAAHA